MFDATLTAIEEKVICKKPRKIPRVSQKSRSSCTVYLCVLYAHPEIKADDFIKRVGREADALDMAAKAALIARRFDIFDALIAYRAMDLNRIIEYDRFELMRFMACNSVTGIKYILKRYPGNPYTLEHVYCAFYTACFRGTAATVRYLLIVAPEFNESMISRNDFDALKKAIRYQPLSVVKQLLAWVFPKIESLLTSKGLFLFEEAASSNKLTVLKYLFSLVPERKLSILRAREYAVFREAAFCNPKKRIISL